MTHSICWMTRCSFSKSFSLLMRKLAESTGVLLLEVFIDVADAAVVKSDEFGFLGLESLGLDLGQFGHQVGHFAVEDSGFFGELVGV